MGWDIRKKRKKKKKGGKEANKLWDQKYHTSICKYKSRSNLSSTLFPLSPPSHWSQVGGCRAGRRHWPYSCIPHETNQSTSSHTHSQVRVMAINGMLIEALNVRTTGFPYIVGPTVCESLCYFVLWLFALLLHFLFALCYSLSLRFLAECDFDSSSLEQRIFEEYHHLYSLSGPRKIASQGEEKTCVLRGS